MHNTAEVAADGIIIAVELLNGGGTEGWYFEDTCIARGFKIKVVDRGGKGSERNLKVSKGF